MIGPINFGKRMKNNCPAKTMNLSCGNSRAQGKDTDFERAAFYFMGANVRKLA
jgi:hypothetical protein